MLRHLLERTLRSRERPRELDPVGGYDLWSFTYDEDDDNLLVAVDARLFGGLLKRVPLGGKRIVDVGCGTGRHWTALIAAGSANLVGYDLSFGMLTRLRQKYPDATVYQSAADRLTFTSDGDCDVVTSTLTLCHVPVLESAIGEWCRVLKPGGSVLLTDFHPAYAVTSSCSFRHSGKLFKVRHYVHSIPSLTTLAARNGLELVEIEEALIDDTMRSRYERSGMLSVFERMKGTPLVYAAHFRKSAFDPS